jgi:class 3 adenylate cyclase
MLDRLAGHLYQRLGTRYKLVFFATQGPAAVLVALVTIALISSYYDPSLADLATIVGTGALFTLVAVGFAALRSQSLLEAATTWRMTEHPTQAETTAAWEAATAYPTRAFRRNALAVNGIACTPPSIIVTAVLGLPWWAGFVIFAATLAPALYATILNYSIAELLMRPLIFEIAAELPPDFHFERRGLPVRKRFILSLPAFTAVTGMAVAAIITGHGGTGLLASAVAASMAIGIALSLELTVLLSRSITDPISHVRDALARVRGGDYSTRVPLISCDELGELSRDFNLMAAGLEEREKLRTAFGTYLDKDVVRFILSEQFPASGVEVDVSILFCDVRGFTPFAERSDAAAVVAALNTMFEAIVPVVERHGGHIDKFMGDGMMAVFGAPEFFVDHADRALAAACEIVRTVNQPDAELHVAVGINSGRVVAGSIGGAGRLNFSVIGDAVNVAARVEAATRQTGDDVLITAATRDALTQARELVSRGTVELKGKSQPVEVLTPLRVAETVDVQ